MKTYIILLFLGSAQLLVAQSTECNLMNTKVNKKFQVDLPNIPQIIQTDTDEDGIADFIEQDPQLDQDVDGDGVENYMDEDSDGDGINDKRDHCPYYYGVYPTGCPLEDTDEDRQVFWVHGFRGSELGWKPVADEVHNDENLKVASNRLDYSASHESLQAAADNLLDDIKAGIEFQEQTGNNFIIAHSMGGLVVRTMGMVDGNSGQPAYNGIITFATPHQGAQVANTLFYEPEIIETALTNACHHLAEGPVLEAINNLGILGKVAVVFGFAGQALDIICGAGVEHLFEVAVDLGLKGVEIELTTDNAVNIPELPTLHKAAFYGIEDDDGPIKKSLAARITGAILKEPTHEDFGVYGASASDWVGYLAFADGMNFYISKRNHWRSIYHNTLWLSHYKLWKGYAKGLNYFKTINDTWKNIIGASKTNLVQVGCECKNNLTGVVTYYESTTYCSYYEYGQQIIDCKAVYESQTIEKPSDGFILAESAMNAQGLTYPVQLMDGSNHLQMRNDSQMEEAVQKIFYQGLGQQFFKSTQ